MIGDEMLVAPGGYSPAWLWWAALLALATPLAAAALRVWTRLAAAGLLLGRRARRRRRAEAAIEALRDRWRNDDIGSADAASELSRILRGFATEETGRVWTDRTLAELRSEQPGHPATDVVADLSPPAFAGRSDDLQALFDRSKATVTAWS